MREKATPLGNGRGGSMLNEWFESIILKRACVVAATYFATHGFHHWGIDISVHIDSDALRESIMIGIPALHHWICQKYPNTWGKWL